MTDDHGAVPRCGGQQQREVRDVDRVGERRDQGRQRMPSHEGGHVLVDGERVEGTVQLRLPDVASRDLGDPGAVA
jgi:hypothetical protein